MKNVYNRKFNALIKNLEKQYIDLEVVDTVALTYGGMDSTEVGHDGCMGFTFYFDDKAVQIVRCDTRSYNSMIGIHINDTDLHHLQDQVDVALRDGFKNIFIHSIANKKAA